jgi:hypothetical protein
MNEELYDKSNRKIFERTRGKQQFFHPSIRPTAYQVRPAKRGKGCVATAGFGGRSIGIGAEATPNIKRD